NPNKTAIVPPLTPGTTSLTPIANPLYKFFHSIILHSPFSLHLFSHVLHLISVYCIYFRSCSSNFCLLHLFSAVVASNFCLLHLFSQLLHLISVHCIYFRSCCI